MKQIAKPTKPSKRIVVRERATYNFDWASKKVSLLVFLDWCKNIIPQGAMDVTLELCEDFSYDDEITWLEIAWDKEVKNTFYDIQLKKYEKQLTKWKKQNAKR